MTVAFVQAITGVVPPELGEAKIREAWPSVAQAPGIASLGRALSRTIILAPLGWLVMSALYFGKLAPFVSRRYRLTNRRLMIARGIQGKPGQDILLADIEDVRVVTDANSDFFRSGTLEILGKGGKVVMTLAGVPEPESFRHSIINACNAWVPGRSTSIPFIPASAVK